MNWSDLAHAICALLEGLDRIPNLPPFRRGGRPSSSPRRPATCRSDARRSSAISKRAAPPCLPHHACRASLTRSSSGPLDLGHLSHVDPSVRSNFHAFPDPGDQSSGTPKLNSPIDALGDDGLFSALWIPCDVKVVDDRQEAVLEQLRTSRLEREADLLHQRTGGLGTLLQTQSWMRLARWLQ